MTLDAGNLYVTDFDPLTGGSIIDLISNGNVTTYALAQSSFGGLAFDASVSAPTAVPEPLTIIGTFVGGTAAVSIRRRLKAIAS